MKVILANKIYDTEKSELIKKVTVGIFGDPKGYEESLYKTEEGYMFLYENGGADSIHPEEKIKRMSKERANIWLRDNK